MPARSTATRAAKRAAGTGGDTDPFFAPIVQKFANDRRITQARMFGSVGLKVGGKVFAMSVKGKLVVKLPRERVEDLVSSGDGESFDPGHGRLMKEWVAVATNRRASWSRLAAEARAFVEVPPTRGR